MELSEIQDVVKEFTEADNVIRKVFPKADPLLVVRLIFDDKAKREHIYTLEIILISGHLQQHTGLLGEQFKTHVLVTKDEHLNTCNLVLVIQLMTILFYLLYPQWYCPVCSLC